MNILVTGGAGFIGSNFVRYILNSNVESNIIVLDALTYAGNLDNLFDVKRDFSDRYTFVKGNILDKDLVSRLLKEHSINVIINFAAESHVDRSILSSDVFISTNIIGTKTLLDVALENDIERYIQISTDEVYGSLGKIGSFTEKSQIQPNSPYSASKAAADHLVRSYNKTHKLPTIITRCSNNYGPHQFPEKLIPLVISNAAVDKKIPVYGQGTNIRDWIYVEDHCAAIYKILINGDSGEVYNIGGNAEIDNLSLVKLILKRMKKSEKLIEFVNDRPGHDLRYSIDFSKLERKLGWSPKVTFEEGIEKTIKWYMEYSDWVNKINSKEYLEYYDLNYSGVEND